MSKCRFCGYNDTPGFGYAGAFHDLLCAKRQKKAKEQNIRFFKDGDMWCAVYQDFVNLQESPAGFGEHKSTAQYALTKELII